MGNCGTREENAVVPAHAQGNSSLLALPVASSDFFRTLGLGIAPSVGDCWDPPVGRTKIYLGGLLLLVGSWDLEVGWPVVELPKYDLCLLLFRDFRFIQTNDLVANFDFCFGSCSISAS